MARARMMVLYDTSVTWGGLVVGTGNKTESLIGYTTLFGDSACAFNPIGDLYKSQVRQLSLAMGVPDAILRKAPSADLWPGQTDEVEAGFTYHELDRLLYWMIDRRRGDDELVALGFDPATIARVATARRRLGVQAAGAADRQARAADDRGRLPLPPAPAGLCPVVRRRPAGAPIAGTTSPATATPDIPGAGVGDGTPAPAPATDRPAGSPGTLYVVATPIGNLADVTLRALDVLRAVPLVAAEDTRLTRRLFARHAIATRLVSHHARNAAARLPELLEHLRDGADLALVTDAGTPLVSDPGGSLVAAWAAEGGRVVPIPGASAVLAAVMASGVAGPRWGFEGFLPRSGRERRGRLARIAADDRSTILFEAPGRLTATLGDLVAACGPDRPAAVCRELTKIHEEIRRGSLADLAAAAAGGDIPARGECAIVVGEGPGGAVDERSRRAGGAVAHAPRATGAGTGVLPSEADRLAAARNEVDRLVDEGAARGEAARRVAAATGLPRRRLYGARPGR